MKKQTLILKRFQKSPLYFIEKMWGLIPPKDEFIKGKHITPQQTEILRAVERAINDKGQRRISVASGHGVGKTSCLSWLLLWYLFSFRNSQVPCTAPTGDQMYDALWKEVNKWLTLMPKEVQASLEWQNQYVRVVSHPEIWFARAKTARKETPEALAGIHADHVMILVDEASGVPEEIYNTAEGALTNEDTLIILISNPTRLMGYFYDSHHGDKASWQTLQFNSLDSPIVDNSYVERIKNKHGADSDEFRIRVKGEFPREDAVDNRGYVPLLIESDLRYIDDIGSFRLPQLGIDPSGEGSDLTAFVVRDDFRAKILASEKISTPKTIAEKGLTLGEHLGCDGSEITVDNFGSGANVAQEMAFGGMRVNAINVGEKADDSERFLNRRAESYFRGRDWLRSGGELVRDERWKELLTIRYKRNISGKIQIMSKEEMRRGGYGSPNFADAWALTFIRPRARTPQMSSEEVNDLTNVY